MTKYQNIETAPKNRTFIGVDSHGVEWTCKDFEGFGFMRNTSNCSWFLASSLTGWREIGEPPATALGESAGVAIGNYCEAAWPRQSAGYAKERCQGAPNCVRESHGVAFGHKSLTIRYPSAIGRFANISQTVGTNNTVIGDHADAMNFSNCLIIGDNKKAECDGHVISGCLDIWPSDPEMNVLTDELKAIVRKVMAKASEMRMAAQEQDK